MITLNDELVTVAEAAKLLPKSITERTVWRWISSGVKGIKLETLHIGGKCFTSKKALEDFVNRCSSNAT